MFTNFYSVYDLLQYLHFLYTTLYMGLRWYYVERIQRLEQEMSQLKLENERLKKDLLQLKELRELHLKLLRENLETSSSHSIDSVDSVDSVNHCVNYII